MRRRRVWAAVIAVGFLIVALATPTLGMGVADAPGWLVLFGYLVVLLGVCGFIWSWIIQARAGRRPGDDRYDPTHDA
ncbi:MAG: hypothetical protein ACU0BS_04410 [Hasllibacter sp.]